MMPRDNLTLAAILLLVLLTGYLIYYHVRKNAAMINNSKNIDAFKNLNNTKVVIFKTHKWDSDIEMFVNQILAETVNHNVDFFVLMHSNNYNLADKVRDKNIKQHVLMFNENDIKETYLQGFYSMWLSNHWILMWFYRQFPEKYQYYWSVEYDVRIVGNSSKIWKYAGSEDFLFPIPTFRNPEWSWRHYYVGPLNDSQKWYGYLQLARYSKKFLEYMDNHFENGENGQDELITFTLFNRGKSEIGLVGSETFLNNFISGSWSVDNGHSNKHKRMMKTARDLYQRNPSYLIIFHPVKY
jgi:hypothetical protein